ncbi:hypothetical protein HN481_04990 [Candidatus Parcubacteria bacterium]|nr:hypothetical protein [Candidatus Parcubacteria bacterium]
MAKKKDTQAVQDDLAEILAESLNKKFKDEGHKVAYFIDSEKVGELSKLPSKDELLAKMVGSLNAPVSGFVNVLAGNLRGLVSVLNNIKDAKA